MKINQSESGWSTANELEFIGALGTYTPEGQAYSRAELLRKYSSALLKRKDWGNMDSRKVWEALQK